MKKFLSFLLVSILGGIITLGLYKYFIEQPITVSTQENPTSIVKTINTSNTAGTSSMALKSIDLTKAAENTVNTVVHVKNMAIVSSAPSIQDYFFGRVPQQERIGTGSGVIISPDGYIVTNNHVINNASSLSVTLNNNKTYEAQLIGTDEKTDIALLKIEAEETLPYCIFGNSDQAKVGEWVLAVGNPFNLTSTVTAGIISAKSRDLTGTHSQSFIQTDAAVNPGNSGGALVNTNGELIGINSAIKTQTGSYIGYSFAVPSNIVKKVIDDILEFGNVQNGILGVGGSALNDIIAKNVGVNETVGFYIASVEENSGADKAGLKKGDIIKRVDNINITKFSNLTGYLNTKNPGDVVQVTILREGETKVISVKLTKSEMIIANFLDMEIRNIPETIKAKYGLKNGVYVVNTRNAILYQKLGIRDGYIITDINNKPIKNIQDIIALKNELGNTNIMEQIFNIGVITPQGSKERFVFK